MESTYETLHSVVLAGNNPKETIEYATLMLTIIHVNNNLRITWLIDLLAAVIAITIGTIKYCYNIPIYD